MTRFTFRLPDIGEGIAEAEIVAWHKQVGDTIGENEALADMMTDKATVELESPVAGRIVEVAGEPGARIAIGSSLAVIETDERQADAPPFIQAPAPAAPAIAPAAGPPPAAAQPQASLIVPAPKPWHKVLASPAVRARAHDLGIDLAQVPAAGDHIRHADLDAFLRYGSAQGYRPPQASHARPDQEVRVIGLRRRIAENMAASKRHIPHFAYVEEIEVTALEALRAQLNGQRGNRPKLTLLPFLIVAICRALPEFPVMNAHYDDEAGIVTRRGRVHLGIATQTDAGLMVPVLRDAQDQNVWQLAAGIARLAEAARMGTASRDELSGSTITLSSLGPLGGIVSTPVINRPEVAIIAPNRITERAVFVGETIRRALVMNLSISCDHRVIDGWDAASFVQAVRRLIESPALLFAD